MFKDLTEIVKIIQFQTDLKDDGIAKRVNYSRPHYNVLKKKGDDDLRTLLLKEFSPEIEQFVRRFSKLEANSGRPGQRLPLALALTDEEQRELLAAVHRIEKKLNSLPSLKSDKSVIKEVRLKSKGTNKKKGNNGKG